ncbi:hypothetical protein [Streptomyces sp. NPDC001508]|uniref:hypothetical protein n=1 Tax=Streptomyces sp. NPDC001508 TaxID=3154656 RepID=UPI003324DBF6
MTSDAELCARIVAHWSRQVLDDGAYGDHRSRGLSNGQCEIVRRVVAAARAVERRQGPSTADELMGRQARSAEGGRNAPSCGCGSVVAGRARAAGPHG